MVKKAIGVILNMDVEARASGSVETRVHAMTLEITPPALKALNAVTRDAFMLGVDAQLAEMCAEFKHFILRQAGLDENS